MVSVKLILNNCSIFVKKLKYSLEVLLKFVKNKKKRQVKTIQEIIKTLFELCVNEIIITFVNFQLLPDVMERRCYSC